MGRATELEVVHMPFGKHKGTALRSIPKDYLTWFVTSTTGSDDIRRSMRIVLAEWGWQEGKASKGKRKKRRHAPKVDGYAASQQRAATASTTIEECPFDVPDDALDIEYRDIMGVG